MSTPRSLPVSSIARHGNDASVLLIFNGWHEGVEFTLPALPAPLHVQAPPSVWSRLFDTALEQQTDDAFAAGHRYVVTGRSVVAVAAAAAEPAAESLRRLLATLAT